MKIKKRRKKGREEARKEKRKKKKERSMNPKQSKPPIVKTADFLLGIREK